MKNLLLVIITSVISFSAAKIIKGSKSDNLDPRKHIYVLDSELSNKELLVDYICKDPEIVNLTRTQRDIYSGSHGANVSEIIGYKINKREYCVYPIFAFRGKYGEYSHANQLQGFRKAVADPRTVGINLSQAGGPSEIREYRLLFKLAQRGVSIVVAAGNNSLVLTNNRCFIFPACYYLYMPKGAKYFVVTALDVPTANKVRFPHKIAPGKRRGHTVYFSGTSQAAAEYTGMLFSK